MNDLFHRWFRSPLAYVNRLSDNEASRKYIMYSVLAGVVGSILQFGEVIARKSLGASGLSVTFLVMTMPIGSLTSIWWARLLIGRNQSRLVLYFGVAAYMIILSGVVMLGISHLLIMFVVFYTINALTIPAENRILQQHIPSGSTGSLFGFAAGGRMILAAGTSVLAGWYMDKLDDGYKHIFLLATIAGIIAIKLLSSIGTSKVDGAEQQPINRTLFLNPLKKAIQLLKRRKDFLRFEIAFMMYGIAFMMMLPIIPLYLVDDLQFDYATIGMARGMVPQLIMIVTVPLFGRIFDRTTPHKLAVWVFLGLAGFPLLLLSAGRFDGIERLYVAYAAFSWYGVVMSGVWVLWGLSSLRFAGSEDAGLYHSVHVAATGIRGVFAPLLGYLVMITMGKTVTLLTSSVLWVIASGLMILMRWYDYKRGEAVSLRVNK